MKKELFDYKVAGWHEKNDYTDIMEGLKNAKGKVVQMAPLKILQNGFCVKNVEKQVIYNEGFKKSLDYNMKPKWAIPVIDLRTERHVAFSAVLICHKHKVKKVPVLIVGKDIATIDKWIKKRKM